MLKLLQSTWAAAAIGAISFMGALVLLWQQLPPPIPARAAEPTLDAGSGFALTANPEIELLITDLRERRLELDAREQGLRELEQRIQAQAAELAPITQEVARLMQVIDSTFVRIDEAEVASLKKQGKMYATMAPENAAAILGKLEDVAIVKILANMNDKETATLLEALAAPGAEEAGRVAKLSEMLRLTMHNAPNTPLP